MWLEVVAWWYAALRVALAWGMLRRRPPMSRAQPFVSVVVAARDEAAHLPRLLDLLTCQTYPHYEIIVADDRSVDDTPAILDGWRARDDRVRSVRLDDAPQHRSPKIAALAQGVAAARGDLLLFTDADCTMPPTWIARIAACFAPDVGAVIGYAELDAPHNTAIEHVQAFDYFAMMTLTAGATGWGHPIGAAGANIAYRRTAYDQVGGFAALPPDVVADDMALIQQIVDHTACRVVFCDDRGAVVRSAAVPTLKQAVEQRLRWMGGGTDVLHRNWLLLLVSATLGTFNGMLLAFPAFLRTSPLRRSLMRALGLRVAADLLAYGMAARRVGRLDLLRVFPLWLPVQIVWTNLLPVMGSVRRWRWK